MHIPIPVGVRRVATVEGAVWKLVSCARCNERYAYLLSLEATGEDHDLLFLDAQGSAQRARAHAEENFLHKSRKVVLPVPCPSCGSYQDDMAQMLKDEASINPLQIAGALIAGLSLLTFAFEMPYRWVLTMLLAVTGLALLAWGYWLAFRFDPNTGDPEPRKSLGRSRAVWGEQLKKLLAASPLPNQIMHETAGSHSDFGVSTALTQINGATAKSNDE